MKEIQLEKMSTKKNMSFILLTAGMAFFMNHANVLFGVNLSYADFFLVTTFLLLLVNRKIELPLVYLNVFLFFSLFILMNSVFRIPIEFGIQTNPLAVTTDYLKLVVLFLYFIVGFSIARLKYSELYLKWFILSSISIGTIGILVSFVPIPILQDRMFFYGTRLVGLMNDPNYFSVIQNAALVGVMNSTFPSRFLKGVSISILVLSIVSSGSKSGFIILAVYLIYLFTTSQFKKELEIRKIIAFFLVFIGIVFLLPYFSILLQIFGNFLTEVFPIFSRVLMLLTDTDAAVSAGGSNRNEVWGMAINIIRTAPLFGVGVGNYLSFAARLNDHPDVAHNTYLQLTAEWGIIQAGIFFLYIGKMLIWPTSYLNEKDARGFKVVRELMIVFLVASMSISLNNARMFWLLLGMAVYFTQTCKLKEDSKSEDV